MMIVGFIPIGFVLMICCTLEWPHLMERHERVKADLVSLEVKIKDHEMRINKLMEDK